MGMFLPPFRTTDLPHDPFLTHLLTSQVLGKMRTEGICTGYQSLLLALLHVLLSAFLKADHLFKSEPEGF